MEEGDPKAPRQFDNLRRSRGQQYLEGRGRPKPLPSIRGFAQTPRTAEARKGRGFLKPLPSIRQFAHKPRTAGPRREEVPKTAPVISIICAEAEDSGTSKGGGAQNDSRYFEDLHKHRGQRKLEKEGGAKTAPVNLTFCRKAEDSGIPDRKESKRGNPVKRKNLEDRGQFRVGRGGVPETVHVKCKNTEDKRGFRVKFPFKKGPAIH